MNKKIFLSTLASSILFLGTNVFASDNSVELEKLNLKIQELNNKVELLQTKTNSNETINDQLINAIEHTSDNLVNMDERIDDVEGNSLSDKLHFGIDFRVNADSGQIKYTDGYKASKDGLFYTRVRLPFTANITDNMKFYGRLSMMKNWGEGYKDIIYDYQEGRKPGTSAVYLERAFVTYKIGKESILPTEFLLGRLPSTEGPSTQFKENSKKEAINSELAFDGASDGGQIKVSTDKVLNLPGSFFRIAYAKYIQNNAYYNPVYDSIKDTNVFGVFFNTKLSKDSKSEFSVAYIRALNIQNEYGENTGDLDITYSYLEFPNLYKSGISAFIHGAISRVLPSGEPIFGGSLLNSRSSTKTIIGTAFWAGFRYKFNLPNYNNPRIGFEYNHGSKNWTSMTEGYSDTLNKFAVRGNAYEIYYSQPLNRYSFIRLGYTLVDKKYANDSNLMYRPVGNLGEFGNETSKIQRFNLTFNLSF